MRIINHVRNRVGSDSDKVRFKIKEGAIWRTRIDLQRKNPQVDLFVAFWVHRADLRCKFRRQLNRVHSISQAISIRGQRPIFLRTPERIVQKERTFWWT